MGVVLSARFGHRCIHGLGRRPGRGGAPREQLLLSSGWRFERGPADGAADLRYDVWPAFARSADGKPADAVPEEAEAVDAAGERVLKRWILPTGNPFAADARKRHVRPPGNPGGEVSYVQDDFDDSSWEEVNLPHDWAIEGPFLQTGPHSGMGRLPSRGVGW